ncbi:energy-coupling factor transporter ATPase [Fructobacillus sp. M2-14]|uniref:Energy-coupling factor transporter ATP-binding protein EcfA2 n=1 Tax=Fructobacillus broussonetiae TaxID=2713173 RepID=A0ABS5R0S2_9LACO|nr:energy-coupling factor transporter ATPase [Fructobacillus broussonetiae]MBS9339040.1 energy-coupling factor transporter ATPase [Fructobacillus broussonetiae]
MAIAIEGLDFHYGAGKQTVPVLDDINTSLNDNQITAIIGQTGSGKSTFVQQLNALLLPSNGEVNVNGMIITNKTKEKELGPVRAHVGMVFQFPEAQLFAPTVLEDVMYGPLNFGKTKEEAEAAAKKALQQVGLSEDYLEQSPFNLSGGQMRRVALAGVLAMDPETMVFDEPAAGLDPQGQKELLDLIRALKEAGKTIVMISHQMEQVLALADRVIVMKDGKIAADETTEELFSRPRWWFADQHLDLPESIVFQRALMVKGIRHFDHWAKNVAELADMIKHQEAVGHRLEETMEIAFEKTDKEEVAAGRMKEAHAYHRQEPLFDNGGGAHE